MFSRTKLVIKNLNTYLKKEILNNVIPYFKL